MDLTIWMYILGGAAVFAVVRGTFSVWDWWTINRERKRPLKKTRGL
jgi:hypothetical protein